MDLAIVRREFAKEYSSSSVEAIIEFAKSCDKKYKWHPLFFRALTHGAAQSVIWEQGDLENLLAVVPIKSIGTQSVVGAGTIPQSFRENEVRIVEWKSRCDQDHHAYLVTQKEHIRKLEISASDSDYAHNVHKMLNLRSLKIQLYESARHTTYSPGCLVNLVVLDASDADFTFGDPLKRLTKLYLHCCTLRHGAGILDFSQFTSLECIEMFGCKTPDVKKIILSDSVKTISMVNSSTQIENIECGRGVEHFSIINHDRNDPAYTCVHFSESLLLQSICMRACRGLQSFEMRGGRFPALARITTPSSIPAFSTSDITKLNQGLSDPERNRGSLLPGYSWARVSASWILGGDGAVVEPWFLKKQLKII